MKIWIDADACPKVVKEVIFSVSARLQIKVTLVANSSMFIPQSSLINLVVVDEGADEADNFIAENVEEGDIVVTADIPLAARVLNKKGIAINIRGETYTEDNISEALSVRNFMKEFRSNTGIESLGGPAPFGPKDKELFTNALNRILSKRK